MLDWQLGSLAAAFTPAVATLGLVIYDTTWKGGSAYLLNVLKCALTSTLMILTLLASQPLPDIMAKVASQPGPAGWLVVSAVIGIVIGDCCWLAALSILGTRVITLIGALKPFVAAVLGCVVLGESLAAPVLGALAVTMGGILLAALPEGKKEGTEGTTGISEERKAVRQSMGAAEAEVPMSIEIDAPGTPQWKSKPLLANRVQSSDVELSVAEEEATQLLEGKVDSNGDDSSTQVRENVSNAGKMMLAGYLMATLDMLMDVYGSVITKQHGGGFSSLEITAIRFGSAAILLPFAVPIACSLRAMRQYPRSGDSEVSLMPSWAKWPSLPLKSWILMGFGVLFASFASPVLGTWALFKIPLAVWNGLCSLGPVWSLPITWYFKNEKVTLRALGGALLAAAGATLLGIVSSKY